MTKPPLERWRLELTPGGALNRRYAVTAAFFGIAACATSVPESPEPVAEAEISATEAAVAEQDLTVAEKDLEVVEVPDVPLVAIAPPPPVVTCRNERKLGSRRVMRVCRTQAEIDRAQTAAEDTLNSLQGMQTLQRTLVEH